MTEEYGVYSRPSVGGEADEVSALGAAQSLARAEIAQGSSPSPSATLSLQRKEALLPGGRAPFVLDEATLD